MKKLTDLNIQAHHDVDINMSPLVDMVFLLLIFFMVTAVFVKETGVEIEKPSAQSSTELPPESTLIAITSGGKYILDKNEVSLGMIQSFLKRNSTKPDRSVVILADKYSKTSSLVDLMDTCRTAGVSNISLATEEK